MKHIDAEELADRLRETYLSYEESLDQTGDEKYAGMMIAIENLGASYGIDVTSDANPVFIECKVCGEGMLCPYFTNECECGTLYNFAGQMLKPEHEWEWEGDDY